MTMRITNLHRPPKYLNNYYFYLSNKCCLQELPQESHKNLRFKVDHMAAMLMATRPRLYGMWVHNLLRNHGEETHLKVNIL